MNVGLGLCAGLIGVGGGDKQSFQFGSGGSDGSKRMDESDGDFKVRCTNLRIELHVLGIIKQESHRWPQGRMS